MRLDKRSLPPTNHSMQALSKNILVFGTALALSLVPIAGLTAHAQVTNTDTSPPQVTASDTCKNPDNCLQNPLATDSLAGLLKLVLDAIIQIGIVVVTLMIVYCGFLFVVAQGNEEKIRSARSALMWTVIGAVILLGAKVIAEVINNTVKAL